MQGLVGFHTFMLAFFQAFQSGKSIRHYSNVLVAFLWKLFFLSHKK